LIGSLRGFGEMELWSLKLVVVGISLATRFFFGLLPLVVLTNFAKNVSGGRGNKTLKYWISVLMFFGGGVLLATSFVHMMPEIREAFASHPSSSVLPITELIFMTGFFLVYLLEEVVHGFIHYRSSQKEKEITPSVGLDHDGHCHLPIGIPADQESVAGALRNLLIVVAISFHGIFEGLAIGLQGTAKDVWQLFLAVSLHECTILFCIGVELIASRTALWRMLTYITIVSLVSPLGISIGIGIMGNSTEPTNSPQSLVVASLQVSLVTSFWSTYNFTFGNKCVPFISRALQLGHSYL